MLKSRKKTRGYLGKWITVSLQPKNTQILVYKTASHHWSRANIQRTNDNNPFTNHWIPLLSLSMAFLAFHFSKLSRPQFEIKEAKSMMDWNLCDNSGNQDGTLFLHLFPGCQRKKLCEQDWQTLGGNGGFSFRKFIKHFLNHWVMNGAIVME